MGNVSKKETQLERDVNVLRPMLENPNLDDMRTLRELHNWIIGMEVDLAMAIQEKLTNTESADSQDVRSVGGRTMRLTPTS